MARRLERPADPVRVRLEMDPAVMPVVEDAAHAARLSLASYCRLVVELLARNGRVTADDVKREADRRVGRDPPPKKGRTP